MGLRLIEGGGETDPYSIWMLDPRLFIANFPSSEEDAAMFAERRPDCIIFFAELI
jgi:hypothetical protein